MLIFGLRFCLGQYQKTVYECNVTTDVNNNESIAKAVSFTPRYSASTHSIYKYVTALGWSYSLLCFIALTYQDRQAILLFTVMRTLMSVVMALIKQKSPKLYNYPQYFFMLFEMYSLYSVLDSHFSMYIFPSWFCLKQTMFLTAAQSN